MSRNFLLLKDCGTDGDDCPACVQQLRDSVASTFLDAERALYQIDTNNFLPGTDLSQLVDREKIQDAQPNDVQWLFLSGTQISGYVTPRVEWDGNATNRIDVLTATGLSNYVYREFPGQATIFIADASDWKTPPEIRKNGGGYTRHGHIYAYWANTDEGTTGNTLLGAFDDGLCVASLPAWTQFIFIGDSAWAGGNSYGQYVGIAPALYAVTKVKYDYRPPWIRETI